MPDALFDELKRARIGVWYAPLADEPDPAGIPFPISMRDERITLANARRADPVRAAEDAMRGRESLAGYVLVPGRAFDRAGTRHGRGGGWYDRFLHEIPAKWLRLGVLTADLVSDGPLLRNAWDEPVDWLIILNDGAWTFVETGARAHMRRGTGHDADRPRET